MDKRTILWGISHGLKWGNKLPKLKRSINVIRSELFHVNIDPYFKEIGGISLVSSQKIEVN